MGDPFGGIAIDLSGTFALVAYRGSNRINRISIDTGSLSVLAGSGRKSYADGVGSVASFNNPSGIAIDPSSTFALIADQGNNRIRRITLATGSVSTLAGSGGRAFADGVGTSAQFDGPYGVAIDPSGVYALVTDQGNNCIRRIVLASAAVSVLAGSCGTMYPRFTNGVGTAAFFSLPGGLVIDPSGTYSLVVDTGFSCVRRIHISSGNVTSLAGLCDPPLFEIIDGVGTLAVFSSAQSVSMDPSGSFALVTEQYPGCVRRIDISSTMVTTVAGSVPIWFWDIEQDGNGTSATFLIPFAVAIAPTTKFALVVSNTAIRFLQLTSPCPLGYYCNSQSSVCSNGVLCDSILGPTNYGSTSSGSNAFNKYGSVDGLGM
jgi:DNA-binding beta-propeller fold protein YncE